MGRIIRFGILSSAQIARSQLIRAIQTAEDCEVLAIASRDGARAMEVAEEHGIRRAYASYQDLLDDEDIDAIYNPLPVSLHAEWSRRAADAGKAVLCEKPLCGSAEEAAALADYCQQRGVLLVEALMYRHHPLTETVCRLLAEGAVGTIAVLRSQFHALQQDPSDIRLQRELDGGAMGDLGVYCVSVLRLLAGGDPEALSACARIDPGSGVETGVVGTMRFPGEILASFACSFDAQYDCAYEICGDAGRLLVDQGAMVAGPGPERRIRRWKDGTELDPVVVPPANHYQLMVEDFARVLRDGGEPRYRIAESIANLRVMDALLASARQ